MDSDTPEIGSDLWSTAVTRRLEAAARRDNQEMMEIYRGLHYRGTVEGMLHAARINCRNLFVHPWNGIAHGLPWFRFQRGASVLEFHLYNDYLFWRKVANKPENELRVLLRSAAWGWHYLSLSDSGPSEAEIGVARNFGEMLGLIRLFQAGDKCRSTATPEEKVKLYVDLLLRMGLREGGPNVE